MRCLRPTVRRVSATALVGLLVSGALLAQPKPAVKPERGRKLSPYNHVMFTSAPGAGQTAYCPVPVSIYYETDQEDMQVGVAFNGTGPDTKKDAPPELGSYSYNLSYAMDTTNEMISAQIFPKSDPSMVKEEEGNGGPFTVICGGMGENRAPPTLPGNVQPAAPVKSPGSAIPVGWQCGWFPPQKDIIPGATARVWVKGKFADPKKTHSHSYDLPANIYWEFKNGKWHASWSVYLSEPLTAKPHYPTGEVPKFTYMEPVLMNHKGEVLYRMYHQH